MSCNSRLKIEKICFFLKKLIQKPFQCHAAIESYDCYYCFFKTQEKIHTIGHPCGFDGSNNEATFRRCRRCGVYSFSVFWWLIHKRKCNVVRQSQNDCLQTWQQCGQYSETSQTSRELFQNSEESQITRRNIKRPKTSAERCRAQTKTLKVSAKQHLFNDVHCRNVPLEYSSRNASSTDENDPRNLPKAAKTSAQYCREYRARQKTRKVASLQKNVGLQLSQNVKTAKTSAERCREYRARKKALKTRDQSSTLLQKTPKTSAQYCREYRARQKAKKLTANVAATEKKTPKTSAQYCREYRARQKVKKLAAILSSGGIVAEKKTPKAAAQYCREYRARKKAASQNNVSAANVEAPGSVTDKLSIARRTKNKERCRAYRARKKASKAATSLELSQQMVSKNDISVCEKNCLIPNNYFDYRERMLEHPSTREDDEQNNTSCLTRTSKISEQCFRAQKGIIDCDNTSVTDLQSFQQTRNTAKTPAERCWEYRARKKALRNQDLPQQNITMMNVSENNHPIFYDYLNRPANVDCHPITDDVDQHLFQDYPLTTPILRSTPKRFAKTSAQCSRDYRERQRAKNHDKVNVDLESLQNKRTAKTSAERSREYRMRKKLKKMLNKPQLTNLSSTSSCTVSYESISLSQQLETLQDQINYILNIPK